MLRAPPLAHTALGGGRCACRCFPFLPPADPEIKGAARRMALYKSIAKDTPPMADKCFASAAGAAAKELILGLLQKQAVSRFGVSDVRTCGFYHGFDWDAFHTLRMKPPYLPAPDPLLPKPR